MHTLIITPRLLHSTLLRNALERQNIKNLVCSPSSLSQDWCPATDALLFPHPLTMEHWEPLLPFLLNVSPKLPLIFLSKVEPFLFQNKKFNTLTRQIIIVDETLSIDEIPLLVKDLIQNTPGVEETHKKICLGDFTLDRNQRMVTREGIQSILTKKEFFLLELLARNVGQVISREMIMDCLWDKNDYVDPNTVDVTISRLRRKMQLKRSDPLIRTVPSLGYQLALQPI